MLNNIKEFEIKDYKKIEEDSIIFHIPNEIINFISKTRNSNVEKGGFLIGYKIKDLDQYTICSISLPIAKDKGSLHDFTLSRKHHKSAKKYIKKHESELLVIGLWHTHPGTLLSPSEIDLNFFKKIAAKSNQNFSLHTITTLNKINFILYNNFEGRIKNEFN